MKDYKRLTNNNSYDYDVEIDFCTGCQYHGEPNGCNRPNGECGNYDRFCVMYNRLNELEDKIENGTLIELPCNVGDTIYILYSYELVNGRKVYIMREKTIRTIVIVNAGNIYTTDDELDFYDKDFGKTVFTTKVEAEQKLKELRGEV